jgi:hypothetical protein
LKKVFLTLILISSSLSIHSEDAKLKTNPPLNKKQQETYQEIITYIAKCFIIKTILEDVINKELIVHNTEVNYLDKKYEQSFRKKWAPAGEKIIKPAIELMASLIFSGISIEKIEIDVLQILSTEKIDPHHTKFLFSLLKKGLSKEE